VGGAAGGLERFEAGCAQLSDAARARLAIENDDRTYGLAEALRLAERVGRPVVFDVHHHHCHDPEAIPDREALALALATWPRGVTPKVHFSSPKTALEERRGRLALPHPRAHADGIDPFAFAHFLDDTAAGHDFDVMLEAKAKDLALQALRAALQPSRARTAA
jgi:UV DNA damage endonuclease